ncbi:hypothetical protein X899_2944 [Burkholderia pseudomallei TSV 25]|uniref:hypothetical protein n=1 Tax=Burkholderia pseudomallei TaxID=28450 RepID=UPI00050FC096|nr:hypothetical protein [Burkholderia pseudomallei]AIV49738.1 hypothetical protein X988_718 [Burkholderia pseudomallei TSV 48]KGC35491.1 hypothetical protein DO64_4666 [Burkholderia pseudomallei]KGW10108.1 hypothetical protein X899_2944 [Burkholderia pseudomallei TSV 25]KIX58604.1 hypothetical protein SZ29_08860 [Burkholderia pseudomallei]
MSIRLTQPGVYADLGDIWLRDQLARLTQKQAQFGGHYRLDADALLMRMASAARAAKTAATAAVAKISACDRIHRATIEAIEHCARLEDHIPRTAAVAC